MRDCVTNSQKEFKKEKEKGKIILNFINIMHIIMRMVLQWWKLLLKIAKVKASNFGGRPKKLFLVEKKSLLYSVCKSLYKIFHSFSIFRNQNHFHFN